MSYNNPSYHICSYNTLQWTKTAYTFYISTTLEGNRTCHYVTWFRGSDNENEMKSSIIALEMIEKCWNGWIDGGLVEGCPLRDNGGHKSQWLTWTALFSNRLTAANKSRTRILSGLVFPLPLLLNFVVFVCVCVCVVYGYGYSTERLTRPTSHSIARSITTVTL